MELLYLWVEDYKNIKEQGFNFSPRFDCKYDNESNELTINEKENYISIFPDNINVTAIVGENGSGKSSLLTYLCLNTNEVRSNIFSCMFKNKIIEIQIYNNFENISIKNHTKYKINVVEYKKNKNYDNPKSEILKESEFIYYSNSHLELNSIFRNDNFTFIGFLNKEHKFDLNRYHNELNENLIYLFTQNLKFAYIIFDKLKIPYPKNILAIPSSLLSETAEDISKGKFIHLPLRDVLIKISKNRWHNSIDNKGSKKEDDIEKIQLFIEKIQSLIFSNRQKIKEDFFFIQFFIQDIFKYFNKNKDRPNIGPFHGFLMKNIFENNNLLESIKEYYKDTEISKYIKELLSIIIEKNCQDPQVYRLLQVDKNISLDINKLKQETIYNLRENDYLSLFRFFFLSEKDINIEYSSGEIIMIDLISRLIKLKSLNTKKDNIVFFLDEVELFLHPQWQKEYLKYFFEIIMFIFPKKKITIFITTHSPFILSDIPKENIIFLKKGKQVQALNKKQTFGANIHTLLSDSFFMDNGLMGEFAKGKIEEIISFHKEIQKDNTVKEKRKLEYINDLQKKFWNIQSIIGDDYLKQVIKNHLIEIEKILLGIDKYKENEIKRLKAQIDLLEVQ